MDFNEFKERFTEDVKSKLYEDGVEAKFSYHDVTKTNESYESLTITPEGSNIGVNLNLDKFYEGVQSGMDYNTVVDKAVEAAAHGFENSPQVAVDSLMNYEEMKDKLIMEVVSKETNKDLLETVPHKDMEDMAVVYRFELNSNNEGRATILATNQMIEQMGVTPEQLHQDAMENAPELKPAVISTMSEVIAKMTGMDKDELAQMGMLPEASDEMMYIASTSDGIHGAGILAYQNFMDQAAERVGGDFFILPSSIHEIIIVPDNGMADLQSLKEMVNDVNATQVAPEDKLTDSVYHYDSQDKVFELGEKFIERQMAKGAQEIDVAGAEKGDDVKEAKGEASLDDSGEKPSLLENLQAKKDEIAAMPKKDASERGTKAKTKGEEI